MNPLALSPTAIAAAAGAWLLSIVIAVGVSGWLFYKRGHDDMRNAYTEAQVVVLKKDLNDAKKNGKIADDAGKKFENAKPQIVREVRDRTNTIIIPPDADPFLPVWTVRMFDRLASGDRTADTYPGEPDGAPSRTRLSGIKPVLEAWVEKYEVCRAQVDGTRELNPVLPRPPREPNFFDRLLNF